MLERLIASLENTGNPKIGCSCNSLVRIDVTGSGNHVNGTYL